MYGAQMYIQRVGRIFSATASLGEFSDNRKWRRGEISRVAHEGDKEADKKIERDTRGTGARFREARVTI